MTMATMATPDYHPLTANPAGIIAAPDRIVRGTVIIGSGVIG